jgi:hypothetical protein
MTRYPLYGKSVRSESVHKIWPSMGFNPWAGQAVAIRYTDWAREIELFPHSTCAIERGGWSPRRPPANPRERDPVPTVEEKFGKDVYPCIMYGLQSVEFHKSHRVSLNCCEYLVHRIATKWDKNAGDGCYCCTQSSQLLNNITCWTSVPNFT